jgi:hypothetical protein
MGKKMTDIDAVYGEFRPTTCEWISPTDDSERCVNSPMRGKSYCEDHYHRVYENVSPEDFEKFVSKDFEESENNIDESTEDEEWT